MYLGMLEKEEAKICFLELAYLLSITDVRKVGDGGEYVSDFKDRAFSSVFSDDEKINDLKKSLVRKESEAAMLRLYAKEMDVFGVEGFSERLQDDKDYDIKIEFFIDDALKRFLSVTDGATPTKLSRQPIRTDFVKDSASHLCDGLAIRNVLPEERKVMIFELLGMAYADSEISNAELEVINHVCEKLDVDVEFVDEAKGVIDGMMDYQRKGLELILE